jgi:flagellar FliL protein
MAQKDAKKPEETAEEKPKSGGKKLLILGLLAGLILGGGGAAAYFLTMSPPPAETEAAPEALPEPEIATAFVALERMSAPLVQDGQILGYVLLDLSLEAEEGPTAELVAQRLPALSAAFLRDMTQTPIGKPDAPMVIDYDSLMVRLQAAANQELGQDAVIRVLVTHSTRL